MEVSRQEYWRGLPFSSPEDLPDPGIEPGSPPLQADSLPTELSAPSEELVDADKHGWNPVSSPKEEGKHLWKLSQPAQQQWEPLTAMLPCNLSFLLLPEIIKKKTNFSSCEEP